MDKEKISEALSYLDDDIIKETDALRQKSRGKARPGIIDITKKPWFKIGLAAAAMVVILVGGGVAAANSRMFSKKSAFKENSAAFDGAQKSIAVESVLQDFNEDEAGSIDINASLTAKATVTASPSVDPGRDASYNEPVATGSMPVYDMSHITTKCSVVTSQNGAVAGTYEFNLSESADYIVSFGEQVDLEVMKDDYWETIEPKEELSWVPSKYKFGEYPGSNYFSGNFDLNAYGKLKAGTYRLAMQIYIQKTLEGVNHTFEDKIYFEFEIK